MLNNIIYIDVDDTVANTREAMVEYYRKHTNDFSTNHLMYDGTPKYDVLCPKWDREQITKTFYDKEFFKILKPFQEAQEYIRKLQELGYDIIFCTAHRIEGSRLKTEWIQTHFPFVKKIIITQPFQRKDKYIGFGFIDDQIHNLETNQSEHKILIDIYNLQTSQKFDKIILLDEWEKIYQYFKGVR